MIELFETKANIIEIKRLAFLVKVSKKRERTDFLKNVS